MEKYNLDSATPYIEKLLDRIEVLENALKEINKIPPTEYKIHDVTVYEKIIQITTKALWPV